MCRTVLKGFKQDRHQRCPPPRAPSRPCLLSLLWFRFCWFGFNDVHPRAAEGPFSSHAVLYRYLVSNTGTFAGGRAKRAWTEPDVSHYRGPLLGKKLTPASLQPPRPELQLTCHHLNSRCHAGASAGARDPSLLRHFMQLQQPEIRMQKGLGGTPRVKNQQRPLKCHNFVSFTEHCTKPNRGAKETAKALQLTPPSPEDGL